MKAYYEIEDAKEATRITLEYERQHGLPTPRHGYATGSNNRHWRYEINAKGEITGELFPGKIPEQF